MPIKIKTSLATTPDFGVAFSKLCRATLPNQKVVVPLMRSLLALQAAEKAFIEARNNLVRKHSGSPTGTQVAPENIAAFKTDVDELASGDTELPLDAKIPVPASLTLPDGRPMFSNGELWTAVEIEALRDIIELV